LKTAIQHPFILRFEASIYSLGDSGLWYELFGAEHLKTRCVEWLTVNGGHENDGQSNCRT